ncbi:MAG: leucine zipper domain-containing protein, partial [Gammaproteobacteria bacterium]
MNSHKHARLTAKGRVLLVMRVTEQGWTARQASEAAGVSERTVFKWLARFRSEGEAGLVDRSSRPRRCPHAIPPESKARWEALRRQR